MKISLSAQGTGDFLDFEVCNNLPLNTQDAKSLIHANKNSSGIGLANVKKRLELGYKPQEYHLEINQTDQHFTVKLKLKVWVWKPSL